MGVNYYQNRRTKALQYYKEHRNESLEYQKSYNKENKIYYDEYQADYFQKRKHDPEFMKRRKENYDRFMEKKRAISKEKRTEKLLMREHKKLIRLKYYVLKELLEKTKYIYPIDIVQPKPEPPPFSGIRVNAKGFFVLDF